MLDAPLRQASSLEHVSHRPWPPPSRSWLLGQTWEDLLFAHWRVPAGALRPHVPEPLAIDEHDGSAWLGVTPFRVTNFRLRGTLPVPVLSAFPELNVRTYVTAEDKPGIWFFSLDAGSALAVEGARRAYRLPYFRARVRVEQRRGAVHYECARLDEPGRAFDGRYRPVGEPAEPRPRSLEWFLTERYCLYADNRGRLARAEIHHRPWPLQPADAEIDVNTMPPVELPDETPLCHFSRRQDVVVWPLEPLAA